MSDDVEVVTDDTPQPGAAEGSDAPQGAVNEPGKLMRIAIMLREMQEEARRAEPDEAGRERIQKVQRRAVEELCSALSDDLRSELTSLHLPLDPEETPTASEVSIAQAQIIGWLEGLFQGIQAAIFSQQMEARQQLDQMRQRGLPPGMRQSGQADQRGRGTGQYL